MLDQGFSAVIFDYLSKVNCRSLVQVNKPWEAQEYLLYELDKIRKSTKKNVPPFIVFSQCRKPTAKNPEPLEARLQGRKLLLDFATGIFEILKNQKEQKTLIDVVDTRWYQGTDSWEFDYNKGKLTSIINNEDEND